jgi:hypothetical protein
VGTIGTKISWEKEPDWRSGQADSSRNNCFLGFAYDRSYVGIFKGTRNDVQEMIWYEDATWPSDSVLSAADPLVFTPAPSAAPSPSPSDVRSISLTPMPSSSPTISPTETPTFDPTPLHGGQHPLQSHRQLHRRYRVLVRLNCFSCGIKLLKHYNSLLAAAAHLTQTVLTSMVIVVLLLTESFLNVVITTIPTSVNPTRFHSINVKEGWVFHSPEDDTLQLEQWVNSNPTICDGASIIWETNQHNDTGYWYTELQGNGNLVSSCWVKDGREGSTNLGKWRARASVLVRFTNISWS